LMARTMCRCPQTRRCAEKSVACRRMDPPTAQGKRNSSGRRECRGSLRAVRLNRAPDNARLLHDEPASARLGRRA
jgi:hypothetical protein